MAKAIKKRWWDCGVVGEDWNRNVLAETRSKARYSYWREVHEYWDGVKITDVRVLSAGLPPVYEIPPRPMPPPRGRRRMTRAAWLDLGRALFGDNPNDWRFVCPSCGRTQTMRDFTDAGMTPEQAESRAHFSCLGRWVRSNRCDWTLGGLLQIHTLEVVDEEGHAHACFDFDEPPCSACGKLDCEHVYPAIDQGERPKDPKFLEPSVVTVPA